MSDNIVISLGSWCRPAWQARRILGTDAAYPYDWNITSFAALMHTLSPDYDPSAELSIENVVMSRFGSVMDVRSGLIFQHDLPASQVGGFTGSLVMLDNDLARSRIAEAREKHNFLFNRFRETARSGPVTFLRWIRGGHPDSEWPEAFEGEAPYHLHAALKRFCGHERVSTVYAVSQIGIGEEAESACYFEKTGYGGVGFLGEAQRKFREESWTGDDDAWARLLDEIRTRL